MKQLVITLMLIFSFISTAYAQDNQLFNAILKDYVKDKGVDYKSLSKDKRLDAYIDQISAIDPEALPSREAKFAFWLNVYNAYSLKVICDHYPIRSINDLNFGGLVVSVLLKKTVWDKPLVTVHGKKLTLKAIDHDILRPQFKDSRIQFTIACGAISCPQIANQAYEADQLEAQLAYQTKNFFNDPRNNSFDLKTKTAHLSMLLKWSMQEFGKNEAELLVYASQYLSAEIADSIKKDPNAWKVQYNAYDLTLNDLS